MARLLCQPGLLPAKFEFARLRKLAGILPKFGTILTCHEMPRNATKCHQIVNWQLVALQISAIACFANSGTILWHDSVAWPTLPTTYQARVLQRCRLDRWQAHHSWIQARTPSATCLGRQPCQLMTWLYPTFQVRVAHICTKTAPAAPHPAHCTLIRTHTVHHRPST